LQKAIQNGGKPGSGGETKRRAAGTTEPLGEGSMVAEHQTREIVEVQNKKKTYRTWTTVREGESSRNRVKAGKAKIITDIT